MVERVTPVKPPPKAKEKPPVRRKYDGAYMRGGKAKGTINKLSVANIEKARKGGELPHEFLLRVMRTGKINGVKVPLELRLEAAGKAAPYYAPKLSSIDQKLQSTVTTLAIDAKKLKQLQPEELNVLERVLDGLQRSDSDNPEGEVGEVGADAYAATLNTTEH